MTNAREVTCIVCPVGCRVKIYLKDDQAVRVEGNLCPHGVEYAVSEVLDPKRPFFTVVRVIGGDLPVVSVRSDKPVPKRIVKAIVKELAKIELRAPIQVGEIVLRDVGHLGVNLIATRAVNRRSSWSPNSREV